MKRSSVITLALTVNLLLLPSVPSMAQTPVTRAREQARDKSVIDAVVRSPEPMFEEVTNQVQKEGAGMPGHRDTRSTNAINNKVSGNGDSNRAELSSGIHQSAGYRRGALAPPPSAKSGSHESYRPVNDEPIYKEEKHHSHETLRQPHDTLPRQVKRSQGRQSGMDTRANNPSSAGNSKRTSTGIIIARSSQVWRGCFVRSRYGGAYLKFDGARAGTKSLCLVYVSLRGSALILRRAPLKTRPDFHRLRLAWTSGGLIRLSSGKFAVYFDRHGHLIRPFA